MARADLCGKSIDCASKSIYELLNEAADRYPDDIALACLHQHSDHLSSLSNDSQSKTRQPWLRWAHAELAKAGHDLAKRWAGSVQPKDRVAFVAGSSVEYHIVLRACLELRCVFAPMNVNAVEREKELQQVLTIVDPSVVILQSADMQSKSIRLCSKIRSFGLFSTKRWMENRVRGLGSIWNDISPAKVRRLMETRRETMIPLSAVRTTSSCSSARVERRAYLKDVH
jgi:long-subunit acyl-CoA synthetase (AMP-forming)